MSESPRESAKGAIVRIADSTVLTYDKAKRLLDDHGQGHVLRLWDQLDAGGREALLRQIEVLDFKNIRSMRHLLGRPQSLPEIVDFEPAAVVEFSEKEKAEASRVGEDLLRGGRVGVLVVAGGQGTRLGFEGPKGSFPIAPISQASLFAVHARKIAAMERKFGTRIPFYVMTSRANDEATRAFFAQHADFGLSSDRVTFFTQGMWPALTADGRIILDRPDHIFMSPDGHGGVLAALRERGVLDDMDSRGLDTIFYFQVDNPLVEIADPAFIGLHSSLRSGFSVKVCAKRDPDEGLGVVVDRGGQNAIVEYTELTDEQKRETLPNGRLKFNFGNAAIHVFSCEFLRQEPDAQLPLHAAHKKIPYCDEAGNTLRPSEPNAYKFERFIFDCLPYAEQSLVLAFAREDEFSPVKNAEGPDSPATAQRDMMRKFKRWLESCGVAVPVDEQGDPLHRIEIDPLFGIGPDELREKLPADFRLDGDTLLDLPKGI